MNFPSYTINLFHIFAVAPFLYYIASQKGNANPLVFTILLYIVYSIVIFHSYIFYKKTTSIHDKDCTCEKQIKY